MGMFVIATTSNSSFMILSIIHQHSQQPQLAIFEGPCAGPDEVVPHLRGSTGSPIVHAKATKAEFK